ncbi:MAG: multidrug transporter subunit MdtD [Betaproteobacteria bacterium]|nr:multidrug transporter subunit MdtD [Betaproteobacteria bacterium]
MLFTSERLSPQSARVLPWLVAVAFFMQMLDGTILNIALPTMAKDLHVDPLRMQSAVIAYMLTAALLIPASGWLADRFGAHRVFIAAVFLFTLGSLFCALSPRLDYLVLSRVLQGVGGALMVPVGRLAVIRAYPRHQLVLVLSFITIPGMIGPLMGPVAGGFLIKYATWHWIFLINLPVGLVGGLLALRYFPALPGEGSWTFDWKGFALFSGAMILVSFAMEGLGELHLPKVQAVILCVIGLLLLALYWILAAHTEHPLFSIGLFRVLSFRVGILGNLFSRLGSGSMPFMLPLFLQLALGFSPLMAGLTMVPSAVAGIVGKNIINRLVGRFGFRRFLSVNTLFLGLLIASFSLIGPQIPYPLILLQLAVFGIVNSMQFTAMNSVTLIDLDNTEASSGNSLLSVTMQLSATCGVAMAAALLDGFSSAFGKNLTSEQLRTVFAQSFVCVGLISIVTCLIFSQTPRDAGKNAHRASVPQSEQEAQRLGDTRHNHTEE